MSDTALLTGVIELVKREVKGQATSDEIRWLKQPENLQRWIGALEIAMRGVAQPLPQGGRGRLTVRQVHRPLRQAAACPCCLCGQAVFGPARDTQQMVIGCEQLPGHGQTHAAGSAGEDVEMRCRHVLMC